MTTPANDQAVEQEQTGSIAASPSKADQRKTRLDRHQFRRTDPRYSTGSLVGNGPSISKCVTAQIRLQSVAIVA
jgi:hypothetical protein